jgi:methyl halide transferase
LSPGAFDWAQRYSARNTPWDLGSAHPELAARIVSGAIAPARERARAFVPGAGRGHDALALARAGFAVTAIELVEALREPLGDALGALGGELLVEDALAYRPRVPFELFLEHTFFCALDPSQRPAWGELARRVLAPGGRLCALVFPCGKSLDEGGPPWGIATADLAAALGAGFRCMEDAPVAHRGGTRSWPERWAVFER